MARPAASLVCLLLVELFVQPARSFRIESADHAADLDLDTERASGGSGRGKPAAATCPGSGFFVDWGSSGMKAFPVHSTELGEPNKTEGAEFKIPATTKLPAALEELRQLLPALPQDPNRNPKNGSRFAILATAGLRLNPSQADAAWSVVKDWAEKNPGVLGHCSMAEGDDEDCQTIPGSQEAAWELEAALAKAGDVGGNFAFASSGGASLQVGFRGSQSDMDECLEAFSVLSNKYDKQRAAIKVVGGERTLVLSFLSIAGLDEEERGCQDYLCDYLAGGLDQARAAFGKWLQKMLKAKENATNPCISEHAELKEHGRCQPLFGVDKCVVDKYGGGISSVPATTHPLVSQQLDYGRARARSCQSLIRQFLEEDLMLGLWDGNDGCVNLAEQTKKVLLMTSFARDTQFGVPTRDWVSLKDARKQAFTLDWVNAAQAKEGEVGLIMSSVMLHTFLDKLSIPNKALLKAFDGSWIGPAMKERALKNGWATADSTCPGS